MTLHNGKIPINTNITIFTLSDLFMWLFMFMTFIVTLVNSAAIFFQLRFGVLLCAGTLGFCQLINRKIRSNRIIGFIILCVFSWIISFLLRGKGAYDSNLFLYSFLYMGMGINMASHRHNETGARILYYIVCGIIIIRLIVLNVPIRGFLKDGTTYNFISVLLLLFLSYYCIELIQNNKRIPYLTAIIFAWLSVLVYGRGGIITGLFFLIFITILGTKDETNKNKRRLIRGITVITVIVGGLFAFVYLRKGNYELLHTIFAKFLVRSGTEEPRFEVWSSYIRICLKSPTTLLFGADSNQVFIDGNLHNAFFQMHSSLGLIPLLMLIYSYGRLALYSLKEKRFYLLCILFTIIIRSMTDKTAFQGYCEPFFYYLVFTWYNVKEKNKLVCYNDHIIRNYIIEVKNIWDSKS